MSLDQFQNQMGGPKVPDGFAPKSVNWADACEDMGKSNSVMVLET